MDKENIKIIMKDSITLPELLPIFNNSTDFNYIEVNGLSKISTVFSELEIKEDNLIIKVSGTIKEDHITLLHDSEFKIPLVYASDISFKNPEFYDETLSIMGFKESYDFAGGNSDGIIYYRLENYENNLDEGGDL